jgi:hypothetical protein
MKHKEATILTIIFLIFSLFGVSLTFATFSNQGLNLDFFVKDKQVVTDEIMACSNKTKLENLETTNDKNLTALGHFQEVCNSFVTDKLMIFIEMPIDEKSAESLANNLAIKLKQFSKFGVSPIVVAEPVSGGNLISFQKIKEEKYTEVFKQFFGKLKAAGITDYEMGTWVPFPEANVPNWNIDNTLPRDFALNVNLYLGILKNYFPQAKGSVLLNSVTYDPEDLEWENGDYVSLSPYVIGLDSKLVDSFGIQGFPWVSKANTKNRQLFDANEFLSVSLAIESAKLLRTKDIWLNTGTFAKKYAGVPNQEVKIGFDQRKAILESILEEIRSSEEQGYRVSINLFAEDKSGSKEATDWSYLNTEAGKLIFKEFIQNLNKEEIPFSLFDTTILN